MFKDKSVLILFFFVLVHLSLSFCCLLVLCTVNATYTQRKLEEKVQTKSYLP